MSKINYCYEPDLRNNTDVRIHAIRIHASTAPYIDILIHYRPGIRRFIYVI